MRAGIADASGRWARIDECTNGTERLQFSTESLDWATPTPGRPAQTRHPRAPGLVEHQPPGPTASPRHKNPGPSSQTTTVRWELLVAGRPGSGQASAGGTPDGAELVVDDAGATAGVALKDAPGRFQVSREHAVAGYTAVVDDGKHDSE